MSMFDRPPMPMEEKMERFCSCSEESDIVIAGMLESLDRSKYHINNWVEATCEESDHIQTFSLLHYKDISPVFDRVGVIDDTKYVNDQPDGAIDNIISEQVPLIIDDEIRPDGVNIHWKMKTERRIKRESSHPISSLHGGLSYMFPGDLVSPYYSDPIKVQYPTLSGLTEEEVYTICTGVILNSTIAQVCGPYFQQDITSALEFCVLGITCPLFLAASPCNLLQISLSWMILAGLSSPYPW